MNEDQVGEVSTAENALLNYSSVEDLIELVGVGFEIFGVLVILIGVGWATFRFVLGSITGATADRTSGTRSTWASPSSSA